MAKYTYRAESYKKNAPTQTLKKYIKPALYPLIIISILFVPLRMFVVFPVKIKTDSMENRIKERSYGFFLRPNVSKLSTGDIVLVQNSQSNLLHLCKVVALPGDKIKMKDKKMEVFGPEANSSKLSIDLNLGKQFVKNPLEIYFPGMQDISIRLPEGEFYCINENRQNIQDSRVWGSFSIANMVGIYLF
ncbi:MAG: signal peptidase I [Leptospirales bacterium]